MYLLGHLGITALSGHGMEKILNYKNPNLNYPYGLLLIGSMWPDLIDKPIGSLIFSTGRWIAHSVLFILISGIILYFVLKNMQRKLAFIESSIFIWGALMHILLDLPSIEPQVVFWPVLGIYLPIKAWNGFLFGVFSPYIWLTEIIGLICLIGIGSRHKISQNLWRLGFLALTGYIVLYSVLFFFWVLIVSQQMN